MEEMKLKKKRLAIKLGLTLMITPVLSGMRAVTTIDEFKQIKSGLESDQMLVLADETRGKKIQWDEVPSSLSTDSALSETSQTSSSQSQNGALSSESSSEGKADASTTTKQYEVKSDENETIVDTPMGFYASGRFGDAKPTEKLINELYGADIATSKISAKAALRSSTAPDDLSSEDSSLPRKDFVDIASHKSWMTQNDFNILRQKGIRGVCIKLTEGTWYQNPYARNQIAMARAAGLTVSTYHYSRFASTTAAVQEANYYAQFAKSLGLSGATLMVNDAEDPSMDPYHVDATITSLAFKNQLAANGYTNVIHYCSASWVGNTSYMEPQKLGGQNIWVAQYLYGKPSGSNLLHSGNAAWQYTSQMFYTGMSQRSGMDTSIDYTGRFTGNQTFLPLYRLYLPLIKQHHYTVDMNEVNVLSSRGWQYEGIAFSVQNKGSRPVYRLYLPSHNLHLWTMDANERDILKTRGWQYEGIAWYNADKGKIPVYRAYSPVTKEHLYTTSLSEYNTITNTVNWIKEGVAWYTE